MILEIKLLAAEKSNEKTKELTDMDADDTLWMVVGQVISRLHSAWPKKGMKSN
jgi:hypothetical protein